MPATSSPSGGSPGNPVIVELAPDVISVAPDFTTGGIGLEVFDSNANTVFRTTLDVGDAVHLALRLATAAVRLAP